MNYQLSVITPCHNVKMDLFQRAYESLKKQTYGFENIEWVITIHNSTEENAKEIEDMVGGNANVILLRLNNDKRTPSSPRNHALKHATGTYIGFLDADDYFEEDVFEVALKHIQECEAQVAIFRYQTESDEEGRQPIRPLVLVDQTSERIIFERETWDSRTFIYGAGMSIWTKIYDRQFLVDNGITFDEDVPLAEDNLFNLDCFSVAKRICYLPQLIGYIYYLNGGSMVQSFNKSADEAMRYAKGIVKIFDHGLKYGLYMNNVMCDLLGYQSAVMLASIDLTLAERQEVSDLLCPYMKMITNIEVSKLYSAKMAKVIMTLPKMVLGHPKMIYRLSRMMKFLKIDIGSKIQV